MTDNGVWDLCMVEEKCLCMNNSKNRCDGDQYDGELLDGCITGNGIMSFKGHPNFIKYDGLWKDGSFEGYGQLMLKNDEQYRGKWIKGERTGLGYHLFSKSSPFVHYKGNWQEDNFNGIGTLVLYILFNLVAMVMFYNASSKMDKRVGLVLYPIKTKRN